MNVTAYFAMMRGGADRALIRDDWIERAISLPIREQVQANQALDTGAGNG